MPHVNNEVSSEENHFRDLNEEAEMTLEMDLRETEARILSGFIWHRTQSDDGFS